MPESEQRRTEPSPKSGDQRVFLDVFLDEDDSNVMLEPEARAAALHYIYALDKQSM